MPSMVMITGKGVPDLATRQLVYMLATKLLLPVMIMTDCDPYGVDICMMYKYGSLAMAWAAEPLAVPSSVWLGLLPSDISRLSIMSSSMKCCQNNLVGPEVLIIILNNNLTLMRFQMF